MRYGRLEKFAHLMSDLKTWVSDNLMKLTGMSEDTVVDFVLTIANKSKSPDLLLKKLEQGAQLPRNQATVSFCNDLFDRIPRSDASAVKRARLEHNEKVKLLDKNKRFTLLDEPERPARSDKSTRSEKTEKRLEKKGKHFRKRQDSSSESDTPLNDPAASYRETDISENVKEMQDSEDERERDLQERDEFAQRLLDRDIAKSLESKQRKREEPKASISSLRERSRYEYLKKREEQRLQILEKEIADEERLFRLEKLSKREIKELESKKRILQLAKERLSIEDKVDAYIIPEDYITEKGKLDKKKQESVLYQRYEDKKEVEEPSWEDSQIQKSLAKPGAKDRTTDEMDYEFLFDPDQQIDFVLDAAQQQELEELEPKMTAKQQKQAAIKDVRESLPIYQYRQQFLDAIEAFQILIIVGETGSGKTTQIPQYLHEAGYTKGGKKIGCTQPRRVAAMSVAARVAEEMGTVLGEQVGYSIRFEDCTSERTVIKYMTDGMLLREFLTEPDLGSYSCIIIDEAHERTLHTDILFGLIKDIARFRPDLKILISSATMDAEKFSEYFDDANIFNVPGRKFPVEVYHTAAPEANYLSAAVTTIMTIHVTQDKGDILLFLTGQDEIEACQDHLQQICKTLGKKIAELIICPIYANLPPDLQAKIFEPTPEGARKVVLATNIAETSITIDGIVYVIDPGFCKQNNYNPRTGMESLVVTPISRASANQRKGRAGRVQAGKCFRLYTQWAYANELEENTVPEIQRSNMASTVLLLKSLGIHDLMNFDFLDAPPAETLIRALEQLYALGALNDLGQLTKLGRRMAEFPVDPMLSKTIIAAEKYKCTEEVASIIAMLSVGSAVFYRPKDKQIFADQAKKNFFRPGGDHFTLLQVWNQWVETGFSTNWCFENFVQSRSMSRAKSIRDQLVSLMERTEVQLVENEDPENITPIKKAFVSGFFYHTARIQRSGDSYRTIKTQSTVHIHPGSSLHGEAPKWVLYHELVLTSKEFMRSVMDIHPDWLMEAAPHYYKAKELEDGSLRKMPKTQGKSH
ncbi:pre-mRNA splicing factor [Gorgonomyces haynaldii]|nr:pre-mRNA splicing factor [Gorgonomyces haynaldii]